MYLLNLGWAMLIVVMRILQSIQTLPCVIPLPGYSRCGSRKELVVGGMLEMNGIGERRGKVPAGPTFSLIMWAILINSVCFNLRIFTVKTKLRERNIISKLHILMSAA